MSHEPAQPLPFAIAADADDVEVAALIESWRYRGPAASWDAIVGHEPQIRRCREVVEALRRPEADLERLRIRLLRSVWTGRRGRISQCAYAPYRMVLAGWAERRTLRRYWREAGNRGSTSAPSIRSPIRCAGPMARPTRPTPKGG